MSLHACLLHNHLLKHQPVYARANITSRNSVALVPFPKPEDETTTERVARSNRRLVSVNIRVLVSVHLKKSPSHDLIRFLKDEGALPSNVLGISVDGVDKFTIRPEAAYAAFSTLTMISLPLAAWHLLPNHGACQFVAVVTSENLLKDDSVLSRENLAKSKYITSYNCLTDSYSSYEATRQVTRSAYRSRRVYTYVFNTTTTAIGFGNWI